MKFLLLIANLSPALAFYAAFKRAIWGAPADHVAAISETIRTASRVSRAAADGDLATLNVMLKDEKIGLPALLHAIKGGHAEAAKRLLQDPRVDPAGDENEALAAAYSSDLLDIGGIIMKSPRFIPNPKRCHDLLIKAIYDDRLDWVSLLLESGRVDPSSDNNWALMLAVQYNRLHIVELLLQDPRVDPEDRSFEALNMASIKGYLEVLKMLIDHWVDPSASDNIAIINAVLHGHYEMVEFLLSDRRVDPSARHNMALQNAVIKDNLAMSKLLLRDWRVRKMLNDQASSAENSVIIQAALLGRYEIVQFLMSGLFVDPSVLQNRALKHALMRGDQKMAEILLEDPRVKALAREEYYAAIRKNDAQTIQLLRKAPGIDGLARETFNE